jgi:hypothetical protein
MNYRPFPELHGSSLPEGRHGAWLVVEVLDGWVTMISSDMKREQRMPVDRFNWIWDQFEEERQKVKK